MLSYFLRQLGTWRRLRETISRQQETIETLEEALKQPCPISMGEYLLIDAGDSYRIYSYLRTSDKSDVRPNALAPVISAENAHG